MTTDLPPTQYLVMEVLAARARTGEPYWTLPSSLRHTLDALVRRGLVDVLDSPAAYSLRVRLTEAGCKHSLRDELIALRDIANASVGPCSSVLPDLRDREFGTSCELRHGHAGDHEAGPTRWKELL